MSTGYWKTIFFQRYTALRFSACLKESTDNHSYVNKDYKAMSGKCSFYLHFFLKCFPKTTIWCWEFWHWRKHQSVSLIRNVGIEFKIYFQTKLIIHCNFWNIFLKKITIILISWWAKWDWEKSSALPLADLRVKSRVCCFPQGPTRAKCSSISGENGVYLFSTVHWLSQCPCCRVPLTTRCTARTLFFILSRYSSSGLKTPQNTSINMQLPSRETTPYFNNVDQKDLVSYSSSRASSVPIIPSVGLDEACMQMQNVPEVTGIKWCKNSYSAELVNVSSPVSNCLIAEQREVKILLETVQEQIRILRDARRPEDFEAASGASENTAFLPMSPLAKAEREAQFVSKSDTQRDSGLTKWLLSWGACGRANERSARAFRRNGKGRKLNTNYLYALI